MYFLFAAVSLNEQKVSQSPSQVFFHPGAKLKLTLSHKIQNYNTILWYQQQKGGTSLKLIGYVYYKTTSVENEFKNESKFSLSGDGEKAADLHISNLATSDSGVYYGAASYTVDITIETLSQKPPK